MGVLLRGSQGEFILNNRGWATLLRLAWEKGWRPAGTKPPPAWDEQIAHDPARSWNRADYVSCRGQRVTDGDAARIGDALAGVVDDVPSHDPMLGEEVITIPAPGSLPRLYVSPGKTLNPFQILGGPNKASFEAFVRYCRLGGFQIW